MRSTFFFIFLAWSWYATAQLNGKYVFHHLDQTDGLLHSQVMGISQDAKGFIWILTYNGLQRYDGSRFVNFQEVVSPVSGTMSGSDLFVDTVDSKICIIKRDHMVRLDPGNLTMETFEIKDIVKADSPYPPQEFTSERGDTWLIEPTGVMQTEIGTNKIIGSFFNLNPKTQNQNNYIILDTLEGVYWIHNFGGFQICDLKTKKIQSTADSVLHHPLLIQLKKYLKGDYRFRYLAKDSDHNLWISTWGDQLFRYHTDSKKLFFYSLKNINKQQQGHEQNNQTLVVNAMLEDRQNQFWIATDYAGLLRYRRETDSFEFITSDNKIRNGIQYNFAINTIFQDRDDNIWLGTDRGISMFNPYSNYFQSIRHIENNDASLPNFDINDEIQTAQGEIWIGTWGGGISVYDHEWNFKRNIHFSGSEQLEQVWSFFRDNENKIWVGCQAGIIHIYDPVAQSFQTLVPPELQKSTVRAITKDRNGNILFGLQNGLVSIWNSKENKYYPYDQSKQAIEVPPDAVSHIFVDSANRAWVSTQTGLYQYDIQHQVYTHLYQPEKLDKGVGYAIQGVEALNDSILLVGTIYKGIFTFNSNTGTFDRPFLDEQLNNVSVFAIKKDAVGNVWFTTNYSIYKIVPKDVHPIQFKMDNYNINASFASNDFYVLQDGRWITSTYAELICFDPLKMESLFHKNFKTEICGLAVFGKHINVDSLLIHHEPVDLRYDQNFVSVEFAALDFFNIPTTQYYYRLTGIDKGWNQTSVKLFADYTDLKPGNYTFEVKADQGDGTSPVTSFAIIIRPPWWGTWSFRSLSVLVLGYTIYILIRKRIQSIRHEAELKHQIAQTEMMALRSQMNPHFIFNCINSIDGMIQSNDKYRATMYLNKFAKLIRNVLDISKENKVPLYKDMETLQLYIDLELFRYQDKFISDIQVDEELMQQDYKVPPLIIQPYVENAIHHGLRTRPDHAGRLDISVRRVNEQIIYTIEDNGTGRKNNGDQEKRENGYGMQMSSDRIRLFNNEEMASVSVTDLQVGDKPAGTKVEVRLNIQ
jgi:ligand-binding sensor domain-containing protein